MRVLVTGANGYLGRAVVEALETAGHEPVSMVRRTDALGTAVRVADLLDESALRTALDGVDAVCHLAGLTRARESVDDPIRYFRVNTVGTITLLSAMAAAGVRRIVFASTGSIYGTSARQPMTEDLPDVPPHPYAASKLAAELAIQGHAQGGMASAVILRLLNVAGGVDPDTTRLVPRVLAAAVNRSVLPVNGDGSAVRDYLHIDDAAAAFVAAVEHMPPFGDAVRFNIGSGRGTSVMDVIRAAERVTGRRVQVEHRPAVPEPASLVSSSTAAHSGLGWRPERSDIDAIVRHAWLAQADPGSADAAV
ncbi:NAD-dependent epimerase/dehydratase family protein [Nocardia cyriacigeorgica]|uniref:UDP-glucose 4-epimerase n=1 Tax=Nocardia cyriacigeorgica TaxID=135487 RepID=A0A5R8P329_9NOCA|nr:NAD-dependent epimerase/dehydratase family protein [Nocardia cyriacigeorgica]TLF82707.1 UDP-glucose 4-epimerase [Nocardia cyriacigeorgica]